MRASVQEKKNEFAKVACELYEERSSLETNYSLWTYKGISNKLLQFS